MGVASAAFLAEAGLSVTLYEQNEIGSGASGRNSGAIQRPADLPLAALMDRSLPLYRELAADDADFTLPGGPGGLLIVSADESALGEVCARLYAEHPKLRPQVIASGDAYLLGNGMAPDVAACRLDDAYPVAPAAATVAYARRASRAGVRFELGNAARPHIVGGAVGGVRLDGDEVATFGGVVVAAGPWTPALVPGWATRPPIRSVWGVVVSAAIEDPPRPVLEELGIEARGGPADVLFSLVTADGVSSVGSTFLAERPDAETLSGPILQRAARFVPALATVHASGVRLCARPVSFDGRPLIGRVPGVPGLFVCAGHGPWGISTGAASARLLADIVLGVAEAPAELDAARFGVS